MKLKSLAACAATLSALAGLAGCAAPVETAQSQQEARCVPIDAPSGSHIAVRRSVCKEAAAQDAGAPVKR